MPGYDGTGGIVILEPFGDKYSVHYGKYVLDCLNTDCGREFLSDRPQTRFCSKACKQKSYRERLAGNARS